MRVTIYGFGYVGKAIARFLKDHYELTIVEQRWQGPDEAYKELHAEGLPDSVVYMRRPAAGKGATPLAVVCVPTPMLPDGSCDTSIVEDIVKRSGHMHFLIKSTIKPGTTEKLQAKYPKRTFTFSPEYIGEGKYEIPFWKDMPHPTNMKMHSFHIFGGPRAATKLWIELWQKVAGWIASYHQTNSRTAELCKYAENMYLATKKLFCSELYLTATAMGVDYHELKELWLLDGRIGRSMTLVWPDKLAFDGKCLPKDTAALVQASTEAGHDPKLFRSVIERNAQLAQPVVSKKTR